MTKQLKVTSAQWNKEFSSGRWNCLDSDPTERARHAVIGMYCQKYFSKGNILDVGCGEGTLTDFLSSDQRKKYLGIDISSKAIKIAKSKRKLNFQCVAAEDFKTIPVKKGGKEMSDFKLKPLGINIIVERYVPPEQEKPSSHAPCRAFCPK